MAEEANCGSRSGGVRGMTIGTFEEESSGYIVYRVPAQNTLGITRDWDDEEISSLARAVDVCDEAER